MTTPEIEQKLKDLIAQKFGLPADQVGPETRLVQDLKMDSFGAIEFMFELEEAFSLSIPDSEIERVRCVQDIVNYLAEALSKPGPDRAAGAPER